VPLAFDICRGPRGFQVLISCTSLNAFAEQRILYFWPFIQSLVMDGYLQQFAKMLERDTPTYEVHNNNIGPNYIVGPLLTPWYIILLLILCRLRNSPDINRNDLPSHKGTSQFIPVIAFTLGLSEVNFNITLISTFTPFTLSLYLSIFGHNLCVFVKYFPFVMYFLNISS
jgi:hypothetical protein